MEVNRVYPVKKGAYNMDRTIGPAQARDHFVVEENHVNKLVGFLTTGNNVKGNSTIRTEFAPHNIIHGVECGQCPRNFMDVYIRNRHVTTVHKE